MRRFLFVLKSAKKSIYYACIINFCIFDIENANHERQNN